MSILEDELTTQLHVLEKSFAPMAGVLNELDPLVAKAHYIPWEFVHRVDPAFREAEETDTKRGCPPAPTRLAFGLLFLQAEYHLSDEALIEMLGQNVYFQFLCGRTEFRPADEIVSASSLVNYRRRFPRSVVNMINEVVNGNVPPCLSDVDEDGNKVWPDSEELIALAERHIEYIAAYSEAYEKAKEEKIRAKQEAKRARRKSGNNKEKSDNSLQYTMWDCEEKATSAPENTPLATPANTPVAPPTSANTPAAIPASANTSAAIPASANTPAAIPASANTPAAIPASADTPAATPTPANTPAAIPGPANTSPAIPNSSDQTTNSNTNVDKDIPVPNDDSTPGEGGIISSGGETANGGNLPNLFEKYHLSSDFLQKYTEIIAKSADERREGLSKKSILLMMDILPKSVVVDHFYLLNGSLETILNSPVTDVSEQLKGCINSPVYSAEAHDQAVLDIMLLAIGICSVVTDKKLEVKFSSEILALESLSKNCLPHLNRMIVDATVAPSNITFPRDICLIRHGRVLTEKLIHAIWKEHNLDKMDDETAKTLGFRDELPYSKTEANNKYLGIAKQRKCSSTNMRIAVKEQLDYLAAALERFNKLLFKLGDKGLRRATLERIPVVEKIYAQQKYMYDNNTHKCTDRIVSVWQEFVRAIYRGKTPNPTEFGQKMHLMVVDGNTYLTRVDWNAFNEGTDLLNSINEYIRLYGCLPEAILADQIYKSVHNVVFCKCLGIRFTGRRLGQSEKDALKQADDFAMADSCARTIVEGRIGTAKTRYGLSRIMTILKDSQETSSAVGILNMNIGNQFAHMRKKIKEMKKKIAAEYKLL